MQAQTILPQTLHVAAVVVARVWMLCSPPQVYAERNRLEACRCLHTAPPAFNFVLAPRGPASHSVSTISHVIAISTRIRWRLTRGVVGTAARCEACRGALNSLFRHLRCKAELKASRRAVVHPPGLHHNATHSVSHSVATNCK